MLRGAQVRHPFCYGLVTPCNDAKTQNSTKYDIITSLKWKSNIIRFEIT